MAASPLFNATITTGHLRRTYIGAPSEYSLHSATTRTTCILVKLKFGRRCRVRSRARRWLQLVGCVALLLDASNFGGPDGVGVSGIEPRRSLRKTRAS